MKAIKLPDAQLINLPEPPIGWSYKNFTNKLLFCNLKPTVIIEDIHNNTIFLANYFGGYPNNLIGNQFICNVKTNTPSFSNTDTISEVITHTSSIPSTASTTRSENFTISGRSSITLSKTLTIDEPAVLPSQSSPQENSYIVPIVVGTLSAILFAGLIGVGILARSKGFLCFNKDDTPGHNLDRSLEQELTGINIDSTLNE